MIDPAEGVKGRQLERLLAKKLSEFLASDIVYTLRRVLSTEAGHAYKGLESGEWEKWNDYHVVIIMMIMYMYLLLWHSNDKFFKDDSLQKNMYRLIIYKKNGLNGNIFSNLCPTLEVLGPVSISNETSYRKFSWSLEAGRLVV